MKHHLIALTIIVGIVITSAFAQQSKPSSPQWEYKLEFKLNEKRANELGAQGWELAGIESPSTGIGNNVPTYVFKRPKV